MRRKAVPSERVFKTAWFHKAAAKAHIPNEELCAATRQVMLGLADDLGGGVFKKRLDRNRHRSIILAKGGRHWVYEFLFAKNDMANISDAKLADLRQLAKAYASLTAQQLDLLLQKKDWIEICTGDTP